MDVGEIRDLVRRPPARSIRLIVAGCLLGAVPIGWSVWQSLLTREALDRAVAAEKTAAQARSDVELAHRRLRGEIPPPKDPALRRSRHDDPAEISRVRQLYSEIDGLTQTRDLVDQSFRVERPFTLKKDPTSRESPPHSLTPADGDQSVSRNAARSSTSAGDNVRPRG